MGSKVMWAIEEMLTIMVMREHHPDRRWAREALLDLGSVFASWDLTSGCLINTELHLGSLLIQLSKDSSIGYIRS